MTDRPTDYSLKLLGTPSLTSQSGGALPGLGPGKSLAMLAFLAVRGQARRDELISLLWGEIAEDKARNAFRQSLHRLRSSLGEAILPLDRDVVSIGDRSRLACDRDDFVLACDEHRWRAAVDIYAGDFLEGFEVGEPVYDRWADAERIKLRSRFEAALRHAAAEALEEGRFPDAIQFASRLSGVAPFDEQAATLEATVLVTAGRAEEAAAVTRRFVQRLREEMDLDPSPELRSLLARLQRADARRKTPSHDHDAASRQIPFVGRDAELSRLIASLADLAAEQGSTVVIQGIAGIGKSRLMDEFASRARNLGPVHVLRGREHSLVSTIPYASVAEALRPLVHAPGVSGTSKHLLAEAARLLPELRDSFELPELGWVDDDASKLRFFEGVAALIDGAAYERPVCIVLDDMHHASASTLELVSYLAGRLRTSPVLLIVAYQRDSGAAHATERLARLADAARDDERFLIVGPLGESDSVALVRAVMIRDDRLAPPTVDRIVRAASGRPIDVIELTRRALAGETGSDALTSLKDVLWGRLQATSPSQRRVFFAASLFERHASVRLLAAAAHLPEPATVDAVNQLVAAGLLQPVDSGFTPAHDASGSFLTDSSGLAGRSMLADWAADALAHEADATDAELANLYALAGRSGKAFEHARKGAFAAASMGASAEALRLLNVALTFAPDDTARAQIESLVTAFGQPTLRLAAAATEHTTHERTPASQAPGAPHQTEGTTERDSTAPSGTSTVRPLVTHASARQWMLSIGLSLMITLLGLATRRELLARRPAMNAIDSLVLVEHGGRDDDSLRIASGDVGPSPLDISRLAPGIVAPPWVRALTSPWTDPLLSPDGRLVALERVTGHGTDLYVVSADRRDTVPIAVGAGDKTPLAWSPDSRSLLVARARTLADGAFDSDLYAYSVDGTRVIAIDTSAARSIVDARWSPSGTHIAWVARAGATRQQEIYVSAPDGTGFRNLTANPAEDFHPAWSPDGTLLAFTSTRSGARRIFAYDFENSRVWPVTDRDGDDQAYFSPDGRYLAFESTRDGDAAVYVSRPLGGTATRITPRGRQFSIAEWRGRRAPYVDRLRIVGPSSMTVGDITKFSFVAVDQYGAAVTDAPTTWTLDQSGPLARADTLDSDTTAAQSLRATRTGDQMLVATIAGWRADSLRVTVSPAQPLDLRDDFSTGLDPIRWQALGTPLPYVGRGGSGGTSVLYPNGDLEWESGVLSRSAFELVPGLSVSARVFAPFGGRASPASLELALVASDGAAIDSTAPRFSPLLRAAWDGQAGALTCSVGAQSSTDHIDSGDSHTIRVSIDNGGGVTFYVDDRPRWRTSLRYLGDVSGTRVRLWIGGRATGAAVSVTDVSARVSH
ncbi:MAG TPA: AAA family ATPase [Gemmatimonadaceae bacterium]|nr:AAA family ATPase [Gemmatimonadaceae bacterium]